MTARDAERESTYRDRLAEAMCDKFFCGPPERRDDALKTWRQFAAVAVAVRDEELERLRERRCTCDGDPIECSHEAACGEALTEAELATIRARTIRDLQAGRIPLEEIAAAQGITAPQNTDDLHAGIDITDEEAEAFMGALAEARSNPDAERADRAEAAIERVRRTAQVWVDMRPTRPTATHDGHTLAWAGQQIIAALSPAGGSEINEPADG